MAKKNENIAEETVKKTTKKAKTEGEAVEKTEEEIAAEIAAKPIRWKKSLNSLKIIMSMLRWRMMIQTMMKLF